MLQRLGGSRAIKHRTGPRDSLACDMEEVSSESARKMQYKEETASEASWIAVMKCGG